MSHYDVLGVRPDADPAAVRRAYVDLARRHHPDRDGGDPSRMRAVNEAWATLGDPARRRAYDLTLALPPDATVGVVPPGTPWEGRHREADEEDHEPFGPSASGWYAVIPVCLFAASVAVGLGGMLLRLPGLLGGAVVLFALSCLAFVAAPLLTLYASRQRTGAGRRPPTE